MIFIVTAMLLTPLAAKEVKSEMISGKGFDRVEVPDNFKVNGDKAVSDDCVVEVHSQEEGEIVNFENFWDVANNGAYSDNFSLGDTSKSGFKVYDFTAQKLFFDVVSFAFDKAMPDHYLSDYKNARFVYFIQDGSTPR